MSERKLATIGARRNCGPTTVEGRNRALAARIRGKLPHSAMIVPGVETAEEWERFRLGVVAEYQPAGMLEVELADRIAHQLWRLRRFSRYEADRAAWRMKIAAVEYHRFREALTEDLDDRHLPAEVPTKPEDPAWLIRVRQLGGFTLWYLDTDNSAAPAAGESEEGADSFIRAAAEIAGLANYKVPNILVWTVGDVRRHLTTIAKRSHTTQVKVLEALLVAILRESNERSANPSVEQTRYDTALDHFRRTQMLPPEAEVKNAARWESHLERSLCRMMDRLERLQRMRAGELVPAPAIVRFETDGD